jgi:hypothetical protein
MSDIYWILSHKNILTEIKNDLGFFERQKFISVFLNIIILTKYSNNKMQYIYKQLIFCIEEKNPSHRQLFS